MIMRKITAILTAAVGAACILASCGDKSDEKSTAKDSQSEGTEKFTLSEEQKEAIDKIREENTEKIERLTISTQKATLSQERLDELRENINDRLDEIEYPTAVPLHSNKVFKLDGYATSLFVENGWEILVGGEATDMQTDNLTSLPAILKYKDTENTITITVVDECESKEDFLKNDEEEYLKVFASEYDKIDIKEFSQTSIDKFDSFVVEAEVKVSGKEFDLIHILSNDVSGRSFSWMFLGDKDEFEDFDLVDAVCYPMIIEKPTRPQLNFDKTR